ncbi:MAG TPA: LacI family DNA-binding transcriptional regulator [Chthonomonadaceae bacterium]|nr:LacI family DNA-binding transcriptional regulator [Chthonomonadaceae bacterium]
MAATIRDVAKRAGVSKATVSYVLNGRDASMRIPEETKRRILEAVSALGYHPNALARSLAHRRTDTVAVVMQYPSVFSGASGFTNEMMHGITDAAVELGYDVLLHTRRPGTGLQADETDLLAAEVATLTDGRVDGALLLRDVDDPLAARLLQRGFPTVLMFTTSSDPQQWFVDCDNVRGALLAMEHLIALGHRRIVHLAGSSHSGAARDRCLGYRMALERAGIPLVPEWIVEITYAGADFHTAAQLFDSLSSDRPTAVFAWSDEVAIKMMRVLKEKGLRVPEDVAVVGFDSTTLCDHTDPPLTSIRQPIYAMAKQALQLLTQRIGGETPEATHVCVAPELVVRRSCGAGTMETFRSGGAHGQRRNDGDQPR